MENLPALFQGLKKDSLQWLEPLFADKIGVV